MKKTLFAALVALISAPTLAAAMTPEQTLHSDKAQMIFDQLKAESKENE